MKHIFEMGWNSYEFYFESRLVDFYITNQMLALGVALIVALRVRKVLKTRKAGN